MSGSNPRRLLPWLLAVSACREGERGYTRVAGTLEYRQTVEGDVVCDATIDFSGSTFAGECPDCDFLFEVQSTLTVDAGTLACEYSPRLSLYETTAAYEPPLLLGFYRAYDGGSFDYEPVDALMVGFDRALTPWSSLPEGLTLEAVLGDGWRGATVTVSDDALQWDGVFTHDVYGDPLQAQHYPYLRTYNFCGADYRSRATEPYPTGQTVYGQLPCTWGYADSFTFRGTAQGVARITVDTVGDEGALAPVLAVYGPDSCLVALAMDDFPCSFGDKTCAAGRIDTDDGEYLLAVLSQSSCSGPESSGAYRLDVDAAWDVAMTPIANDVQNSGDQVLEMHGSATLTE